MSGLLSLPDELLKSVLNHLPLNNRLGSCCLVHSRLHAAGVAATQQVEIGSWGHPPPPERVQSLLSWLSLYGQHVTSFEGSLLQLTQLPCPNLLELRLHGGSIQLGPTADGRPGVAEGITKLTRLVFVDVRACGGPDGLSRLVHLRRLEWCSSRGPGSVTFGAATLPRLQHLTHLRARLPLANVLQLGALTSLQELVLEVNCNFALSHRSLAGLVLPASLTELVTKPYGYRVQPALLALAPTGLRALRVLWDNAEGAEPPPFSCLARLQCLTQLQLCARGAVAWPPAGPAYSAITASSSLVALQVAGSLPAGVWPFVFRAPQQLPRLTYLSFDEEWTDRPAPWAFGAADLAALTSCCPGLCSIGFICLQPGPHVSELHKLTALTDLFADFSGGDCESALQGLAAITQLRDLDVSFDADIPLTPALLPLTSLTALTSFCTCDNGEESAFHTEAGSPPDVWLQLLEHCASEEPSCQPTALRILAQRLSAQTQQIAGLQAQLSDQRQRNEVLQQQHAAAQQVAAGQAAQVAVLQGQVQQLVAQQQVAAGQAARIAALEGQLQQLLQRLL